jgi:16S rRNA (cytosine967-C5)-methyltransferase
MTSHGQKNAREIATAVLNRFDPKRGYAAVILYDLLPQTNETQRATDLVFGTIRNRSAIDKVIAEFSGRPVERIQPELLNIIRVASFELIYCPQAPEYSIVNEAVNMAKALARKKQTAFVNAVLRQIERHIQHRQIPLSQADPQKTFPQSNVTGCQFDKEIFADLQTSPAEYFSIAFSLPEWLLTDWLTEFSEEQVRQICFASNRRPSIYIRPNTLKTTTQQLAEKFHAEDVDFEIVPLDNLQISRMIKIKSPRAITGLPGFQEGLFTVQDITAALPARLLNPQPGWKILDLCAAPGTKTTQLAELTEDSAKIIATDIDPERLKSVKDNTARLGINSVSIVGYENLEKDMAQIVRFDAVLLDAPCSNTGVLAKRIEVRYRVSPKAIKELAKTQASLLAAVVKMLKPKGRICYSTCSIQRAENSQLVKDFLRKNPDFELDFELLTLPSAQEFDRDGGYVAVITRK